MVDLEKKLSIAKLSNMDYSVIAQLEGLMATYSQEVSERQQLDAIKASLKTEPIESDPEMANVPFIPMKKPE